MPILVTLLIMARRNKFATLRTLIGLCYGPYSSLYCCNFFRLSYKRLSFRGLVLFTAILLSAWQVAAELAEINSPEGRLRLVQECEAVSYEKDFLIGIDFKLQPGWHIYWKNPGDSGLAPKFKWRHPEGVSITEMDWPRPKAIPYKHLVNYGYEDQATFLYRINLDQEFAANKTLDLEVEVDWLVCSDICIPKKDTLSINLTVSKDRPKPSKYASFIEEARAKIPSPNASLEAYINVQNEDSAQIRISNLPFSLPELEKIENFHYRFFPLQDSIFSNANTQEAFFEGQDVVIQIVTASDLKKVSKSITGILVLNPIDASQHNEKYYLIAINNLLAEESELSSKAADGISSESGFKQEKLSLGYLIILALLGGLILNLMPCVFPVIAIKVISIIEHKSESKGSRHALFYVLGVLVSMWALFGLLIAFRAAGHAVGWGFHLQSPVVLTCLSLLFFILGLNFFGYFEIGSSLTSLTGKVGSSKNYLGSFGNGLVTTLAATPCTAPFMGVALGYSLTIEPAYAFLVFTALGLGVALPFSILVSVPRLLKLMPRPGPWLENLKEFLAFPLFVTSLWLLWSLNQQVGATTVALVLLYFLASCFLIWLTKKFAARWSKLWIFCTLMGLLGLFLLLYTVRISASNQSNFNLSLTKQATIDEYSQIWEAFSEEKLDQLRNEGRDIYLDYTAAWCITCQVNKKIVFSSEKVRKLIKENNIVLMRADWTRYDEEITNSLASFKRTGVPLTVVFRASRTEPIILPALLTPEIVMKALRD